MDVKLWLRAEWDRVAGVSLLILGAIFLIAGYNGVSNSAYVAAQMAYVVSGGLGGLFLLGVGALLLLRGDLFDHWRQLDRIEAAIRREPDPAVLPVAGIDPVADHEAADAPPRRRRKARAGQAA